MALTYRLPNLLVATLAFIVIGCGSAPTRTNVIETEEPGPGTPPETQTPAESGQVAFTDDGTVRLEGTPQVPADLRERLQQYLETRSAGVFDVSPDGRCVLIGTRFSNTNQVHEVCSPLGMRRQLTFGADPIAGASYVPGDPHHLILHHDRGGNENYQLYRLNRQTGQEQLLTDGSSRNPSYIVAPDGGSIWFTSNRRTGRDFDLWTTDWSGTTRLIKEFTGDFQLIDANADGTQLLLQESISIADLRFHVVSTADPQNTYRVFAFDSTGCWPVGNRRCDRPAPPSSDRAARFMENGQIAFTSDRFSDFVQLFVVNPARDAGPTIAPLTNDIPWNVEDVVSVPGALFFVVNEDGYSKLYRYDLRTRRRTEVSGLPRGVILSMSIGHPSASNRNPNIAVSLATPTNTSDVFTISARSLSVTRITESEMGGLDPTSFATPSLIHYSSFDGRQIPAFVYQPRASVTSPSARPFQNPPWPVLIAIHGGPEAQSLPVFSPLYQFLATEEGVAVIVPNVRGSDGYGKAYLGLDNGQRREDSVRDIGALLDWIALDTRYNTQRVAVYGGSYGGYMVLASLTHYSDRLVGGIEVVGISNFVTFLENTSPYRVDLRRVEYGDERIPEMRSFLSDISPLNNVERIRVPLFVAQGANDPRVPASEAEQIVRGVRANGQNVWYMLARDEGHGFARKANRDRFTELSVLFLRERLRGTVYDFSDEVVVGTNCQF